VKRNLITLLGVVAMVAAIAVVRAAFDQSPKTDAEIQEAAEAEAQLEEAATITDTARKDEAEADSAVAKVDTQSDGNETDTIKVAAAETPPSASGNPAPVSASVDEFEKIAAWPEECPDVFRVKFESTAGPFVIEVTKAWAPNGAERFYELCKIGFFNESGFYRAVKDFMVQFGLAKNPKLTAQYKATRLTDDPVRKSNQPGKVTFAKSSVPHSRTTQVFINYRDNGYLDKDGFAPFGEVIAGMDNVKKIYSGYGEKSNNQVEISRVGSEFLKANFPELDYINDVILVK
jgi:peptidyl-prolyl cis-trans isomerase A (cyclophilin A)